MAQVPLGQFRSARARQCEPCREAVNTCGGCGARTAPVGERCQAKWCDDCRREKYAEAKRLASARALLRPKTCPVCLRDLPRSRRNFYVSLRHPDGGVKRYDHLCKRCRNQEQRLAYRTNAGRRSRALASSAERAQRVRDRRRADPEFDEAWLRHAAEVREAYGRKRALPPGTREDSDEFPDLPVGPLVARLEAEMAEMGHLLNPHGLPGGEAGPLGIVCARVGVPQRTFWAWQAGQRQRVEFDKLDAVLQALGLLWWEVYDPELAPGLYSPLEWIDLVDAASRAFEGEALVGA